MEKILYKEKSLRLLFPSYFKICENRIEAYFWPIKYSIPFSDIKEIRIVERIPWYIGWGLRIGFNRRLYFTLHHGKSIEIVRKRGHWRKIVLSTKHPEKFISIIKKI